jgi:hypothetical protein
MGITVAAWTLSACCSALLANCILAYGSWMAVIQQTFTASIFFVSAISTGYVCRTRVNSNENKGRCKE